MNIAQWLKAAYDHRNDYVLITGASSGIGLEYLKAFARLGCNCIATSVDTEELARAGGAVRDETGSVILEVVADLGSTDGVRKLLSFVRPYSIAVLINNAGFGIKGAFLDTAPERYTELVSLNSLAPTLISHELIPQMLKAGRGLVIHVASINAVTPIAYNAVYTATKAYLLYYAYAVAYELRDTPVVFQIVLPGTTNTPFHRRQGAVPGSMVMEPEVVVKRSLSGLGKSLSISNRIDRVLFPIVMMLPLRWRTWLGTRLLRRRLKFRRESNRGGAPVQTHLTTGP